VRGRIGIFVKPIPPEYAEACVRIAIEYCTA